MASPGTSVCDDRASKVNKLKQEDAPCRKCLTVLRLLRKSFRLSSGVWQQRTFPDKTFQSLKRKMYLNIYLSISLCRSLSSSHPLLVTRQSIVNIWEISLPMNQVSFSEWVGTLWREKKLQCLSPFSELRWMMSILALSCSNRLIHVKSSWFAFQRLTLVSSDFHFELWWICCWIFFFNRL